LPLIYGHRGARGEAPENTIAGFLHARAAGVAGIETDIALTADLVPVMHHDPDIAGGGLIRDIPAAKLPGIPTLAQSLAMLPGMAWLLEIKTFPDRPEKSHPPETMVQAVLQVLDAAAVDPDKIAIKAFDWRVLREVARLRPQLRRICLTAPATEAAREIWWGREVGLLTTPQAVAATGAWGWSAFHQTLTAAQIGEAKALGLKIFAWTVNDANDYARLAPAVDGVVTDYPSRFRYERS
jgi:glycerophosphoryl diester phosphodiesterase